MGSSLLVAKEALGLDNDAELPKVALMFLTRGDMPYEATWLRFLEGAPLKGAAFMTPFSGNVRLSF